MVSESGAAVGDRRSQPLPDRAASGGEHAHRTSAGAAGGGLLRARRARGDADGPRYAVVECAQYGRHDQAVAVADATRDRAALEPGAASADAGQGGALSRRVAAGAGAARDAGWTDAQRWLDEFRWEHNHVRPHEALAMQTPASRWRPSVRRYDPNPPRWEYPAGGRVLKVDSQGKLTLARRNWNISDALAGEWVEVVPVGNRLQVYYCSTLIREIDLGTSARPWSSAGSPAQRKIQNCKGCVGTLCKACLGTRQKCAKDRAPDRQQ